MANDLVQARIIDIHFTRFLRSVRGCPGEEAGGSHAVTFTGVSDSSDDIDVLLEGVERFQNAGELSEFTCLPICYPAFWIDSIWHEEGRKPDGLAIRTEGSSLCALSKCFTRWGESLQEG